MHVTTSKRDATHFPLAVPSIMLAESVFQSSQFTAKQSWHGEEPVKEAQAQASNGCVLVWMNCSSGANSNTHQVTALQTKLPFNPPARSACHATLTNNMSLPTQATRHLHNSFATGRGTSRGFCARSSPASLVSYSCRLRPLRPAPGAHHLKSPHVPSPAMRSLCVMWCSPNPRATATFPSGYLTAIAESSCSELWAVTGSMILPSFHWKDAVQPSRT